VGRLIAKDIVQGPMRKVAVAVAAQLKSALPVETVLSLLRDGDPKVRADACRCAGPWPAILQVLPDLANDGDSDVRVAGACALGRMGRHEGRQIGFLNLPPNNLISLTSRRRGRRFGLYFVRGMR
jgi:hypothetical protein